MSFRNRKRYATEAKRSCNNEAYIQQEKLTEKEVGIKEYINENEGFSAIIKARYSDFHVNEINLDGEVAKLTSLDVPKVSEENISKEEGESFFKDVAPDICNEIRDMLEKNHPNFVQLDVTNFSKEQRSRVHQSLRAIYQSSIVAETIEKDDKKFIKVEKYVKECRSNFKWPSNLGEYVYFLVYKECLDTMEACLRISSALKIKPGNLTYAGVKDRRAKTTQWFSIKKFLPEKISQRTKSIRNVKVGNFTFKDKPLKLGDLKGNRFRVALRNITVDDETIARNVNLLKATGFINYYGLQRFGCDKEVPTYAIGVKLLKGQFKEACDLILKVKKTDYPNSDATKAKLMYASTSNAKLSLNEFSRGNKSSLEFKLLEGLAKNNANDYVNSLENVPRNMRLLYIHSFQSLVWNEVVSRRIKNFGAEPIVGDLVIVDSGSEDEIVEFPESDVEEKQELTEEHNEKTDAAKVEVKSLKIEDLQQYSIYDVVLPLPGYDVVYPDNEMKNHYEDILRNYDLTTEMPKQSVKTYNLSGAYRKIVGKVQNLKWKILRYNQPEDVLIRSDYEELKGDDEPEDQPDGKYKALVMDFCLNPSTYATMAIREVLKTDTNTVVQAKLNNYYKEQKPADVLSNKEKSETKFEIENNLLLDKEKYEEFKNNVFAEDGNDNDEPLTKVAKIN